MYTVASPDTNPRGWGQLPNPNECKATLTSGTNNIYPYPYIDINDRCHRLRITHTQRRFGFHQRLKITTTTCVTKTSCVTVTTWITTTNSVTTSNVTVTTWITTTNWHHNDQTFLALIPLHSPPSRQSLCFDSKLVVVVVVIGSDL